MFTILIRVEKFATAPGVVHAVDVELLKNSWPNRFVVCTICVAHDSCSWNNTVNLSPAISSTFYRSGSNFLVPFPSWISKALMTLVFPTVWSKIPLLFVQNISSNLAVKNIYLAYSSF